MKNLPPIDEKLAPKELWKKANRLSREGNAKEAVWLFTVALFLDFSFDALGLAEARKAVDSAGNDDPVAKALSIVTHINGRSPFVVLEEAVVFFEKLQLHPDPDRYDAESIEQIDRTQFALGVARIFSARLGARGLSMGLELNASIHNRMRGFEMAAQHIKQAESFISPQRWLTMQFELGYSNFDIAAVDEAKNWLQRFKINLNLCEARSGSLSEHWKTMKSRAEQKLCMLPLFEQAQRQGFGI